MVLLEYKNLIKGQQCIVRLRTTLQPRPHSSRFNPQPTRTQSTPPPPPQPDPPPSLTRILHLHSGHSNVFRPALLLFATPRLRGGVKCACVGVPSSLRTRRSFVRGRSSSIVYLGEGMETSARVLRRRRVKRARRGDKGEWEASEDGEPAVAVVETAESRSLV